MLIPSLETYIKIVSSSFDQIPEERKKILRTISQYVQEKTDAGQTAELIYVCTHNSRRSHLGQIWGKTAAEYYGIKNVNTYSAGTEATAFHPNAIKALQKAGFIINKLAEGENPRYEVIYNQSRQPIICFSKTTADDSIPASGLCAIMTCTEADGNCPFIPGTELRVSCPYQDPKIADGTPQQEEKYDERCRQIAAENLYVFSLVGK